MKGRPTLEDCIDAGLNVEVMCTNKLCSRNRVLDARRLLARWRLNLWWNTVVRELGEHMRCEACGRKYPWLTPVGAPPDPGRQPAPADEREAKRMAADRRG